jgi:hypothetical protein
MVWEFRYTTSVKFGRLTEVGRMTLKVYKDETSTARPNRRFGRLTGNSSVTTWAMIWNRPVSYGKDQYRNVGLSEGFAGFTRACIAALPKASAWKASPRPDSLP